MNNDYRDYLQHHGILGMRWGVRRYQNKDGSFTPAGKKRYSSIGLRSIVARAQNDRVDRSFKKWKQGSEDRDLAIDLGKRMNEKRIQYENNRSDKAYKKEYLELKRAYKKALKSNTTYRKGVVRQEVGRDISRKYLSEANKVKKQMNANPNDSGLQKRYNKLMSQHDVERARARRAVSVAQRRSRRIAGIKRGLTMSIKAAVAAAAVSAINHEMRKNNISIDSQRAVDAFNRAKELYRYMY